MNTFDRVCRAIGISVGGSAVIWLVTFGIAFIVDDAHHQKATVGWGNHHGSGAWVILPVLLTIICVFTGIVTSAAGT